MGMMTKCRGCGKMLLCSYDFAKGLYLCDKCETKYELGKKLEPPKKPEKRFTVNREYGREDRI